MSSNPQQFKKVFYFKDGSSINSLIDFISITDNFLDTIKLEELWNALINGSLFNSFEELDVLKEETLKNSVNNDVKESFEFILELNFLKTYFEEHKETSKKEDMYSYLIGILLSSVSKINDVNIKDLMPKTWNDSDYVLSRIEYFNKIYSYQSNKENKHFKDSNIENFNSRKINLNEEISNANISDKSIEIYESINISKVIDECKKLNIKIDFPNENKNKNENKKNENVGIVIKQNSEKISKLINEFWQEVSNLAEAKNSSIKDKFENLRKRIKDAEIGKKEIDEIQTNLGSETINFANAESKQKKVFIGGSIVIAIFAIYSFIS